MDKKFLAEIGLTTFIGLAIFAWIFGQPLAADQLQRANGTAEPALAQQAGKSADQIPPVKQASAKAFEIRIEPTAAPAALPNSNSPPKVLKVVATSLKLRAEPTATSRMMRVYANGSSFEQIGQEGEWLQVRHVDDGASGWMHGDYLQPASGT